MAKPLSPTPSVDQKGVNPAIKTIKMGGGDANKSGGGKGFAALKTGGGASQVMPSKASATELTCVQACTPREDASTAVVPAATGATGAGQPVRPKVSL